MLDALVLDLDGTIVDCAARHHACYADLAREYGFRALDARTYWNMKRARAPWASILAVTGGEEHADLFVKLFVNRVELPRYLALDRPYPGTLDALGLLRNLATRLHLATMRSEIPGLHVQLVRLGIDTYFDRVAARGTGRHVSKADLATEHLADLGPRTVWIGDTEDDVAAARRIGAFSCVVDCGLRERSLLEACKPDLVASDLRDAANILDKRNRNGERRGATIF
jgi:phosphoglycolate phosphatase